MKVINEKENYENEKSSNKAMRSTTYSSVQSTFYCCNELYNCELFLDLHEKKKSISLRENVGSNNLNLFVFIFSQLFICAIVAAICAICMQWILSTMNKSIVHVIGFTIHIDVLKL